MIRNKAIVNEDATGNVLQLQGEIKRLRGLIQRYKSENAGKYVCLSCLSAI